MISRFKPPGPVLTEAPYLQRITPWEDGLGFGRLAYAATAPELIERFPQRVDGVELARKYLLALLPLSESLGRQGSTRPKGLSYRAERRIGKHLMKDIRSSGTRLPSYANEVGQEPSVFSFAF